ncbi:MAG: ZPR1 zinc finger domain-containing protein [Desulfurococcales archaeon]|nr:ZPR1 zinc finger domain-containing protein [Desulfurococcales archaeon]MCE4622611.1 ZPR1 zinc finger domain-containing protein [Desulfurococcales archaeon]MCE4626793.1 ZPR1 zinc finger domain-containing protein [Desulfurococcales archaeon]
MVDTNRDELGSYFDKIKEPILLYKGVVTCPVCRKKSLELEEHLYEVPYFGRILLSSGKCTNCGYVYKDVRLAETTKPKKIVLRVKGEKELRYLLVKSSYAYLSILEKNYEMIPGPASHGFISTVEGVLHRFMEALEVACKGREEEPGCLGNKKWLERAIDGKEEFTLVICDYEGASKIMGDDVIEEPLDEYCSGKKPEWMYSWS